MDNDSSLLVSLPCATCVVDPEGRILNFNPALGDLFGWALAEKQGQFLDHALNGLVDPAQALSWRVALGEALSRGVTTDLSMPSELQTDTPGGDHVCVVGAVAPWNGGDRARGGAVVVFQECRASQEAEASRARFLAMIAHELRSPLNNLVAAVEQMGRYLDDAPSPVHRLWRIIREEVNRLARVIGSCPTSAPLELDGAAWQPESVPLPPILERVAQDIVTTASDSKIQVRVPGPLPNVWGDAQGIRYVLGNLVASALTSAPYNGRIILRAEAQPSDVAVQVYMSAAGSATEPGEDPLSRPGWQPRAGTYLAQDLGLLVTRKLVHGMGGALWSEQLAEGGRRFCLRLPLAEGRETGGR
jgi:signal transduction histidine kinase